MATVIEHYEKHLAPVYLWMAGGFDPAVARGQAELDAVLPLETSGLNAVDLGAGFGMHAIPLARRGYSVLAIDTSSLLLDELRRQALDLPIRAVVGDLARFDDHLRDGADVVLCMGDTLTHLPDETAVETLFARVCGALRPGGRFVTTFRDYTSPLPDVKRFIPVRSDADRILTCFLEYGAGHVDVHDVLHERDGGSWRMTVSSYRKLRLSPQWVADALSAAGLASRLEPGPSGMVRAIATRG